MPFNSSTRFLNILLDVTFFVPTRVMMSPTLIPALYALLFLLMSFYYRVDSVMIERLLPNGKEQAGVYAQGFRILEAAFNFALLFPKLKA